VPNPCGYFVETSEHKAPPGATHVRHAALLPARAQPTKAPAERRVMECASAVEDRFMNCIEKACKDLLEADESADDAK
jgi:hypothetical protein